MSTLKKIYLFDITLRDGSHAICHQYSVERAMQVARALDEARVDSGGALSMNDVRDRFKAFKGTLKPETQTGIHAHHNLSQGVANAIVAIEEGCAGVYSSFLRHSEAAAHKYGLKTMDILVELGRQRMVGGQEDMVVDVALDLLKQAEHERTHAEPTMSEAS